MFHELFLLSGEKGLGQCDMTYILVSFECDASVERNCSSERFSLSAHSRKQQIVSAEARLVSDSTSH